ncbi:MAG: hypothetical protein PHP35_02970 [Candidatus Colwellbacteria bacterium]|nr:hypothetical protein [Candidatus Colwellbacteria bacterium]
MEEMNMQAGNPEVAGQEGAAVEQPATTEAAPMGAPEMAPTEGQVPSEGAPATEEPTTPAA